MKTLIRFKQTKGSYSLPFYSILFYSA